MINRMKKTVPRRYVRWMIQSRVRLTDNCLRRGWVPFVQFTAMNIYIQKVRRCSVKYINPRIPKGEKNFTAPFYIKYWKKSYQQILILETLLYSFAILILFCINYLRILHIRMALCEILFRYRRWNFANWLYTVTRTPDGEKHVILTLNFIELWTIMKPMYNFRWFVKFNDSHVTFTTRNIFHATAGVEFLNLNAFNARMFFLFFFFLSLPVI